MLPRHEIIAWREHADWSRDAQIEQDLDRALSHASAEQSPVNPGRITSAFTDYMRREGTRVTRADFERALEQKLTPASFRGDMAAMLPAGKTLDVDAAGARVRSLLLSHLPDD